MVTMKGGMGNGLELMLDIQQDEYLPVWGETGKFTWRIHHMKHSIPTSEDISKNTGLLCMFALKPRQSFSLIN